jgi:hypothetical protein
VSTSTKEKKKTFRKNYSCVFSAEVFTLHLGSNSLVDDDDNRVTVAATYSVPHPDYDPSDLENDIGLIRIDTAYKTNGNIKRNIVHSTYLEMYFCFCRSHQGHSFGQQ